MEASTNRYASVSHNRVMYSNCLIGTIPSLIFWVDPSSDMPTPDVSQVVKTPLPSEH